MRADLSYVLGSPCSIKKIFSSRNTSCVQALRWFTIEMDYEYDPNRSGSPADWLLDLVSVNFADQGCTTSETMTSEEEVVRAANLFAAEQLARNMGRPAGENLGSERLLSFWVLNILCYSVLGGEQTVGSFL